MLGFSGIGGSPENLTPSSGLQDRRAHVITSDPNWCLELRIELASSQLQCDVWTTTTIQTLERRTGNDPATFCLASRRSTTELPPQMVRRGRIRTSEG